MAFKHGKSAEITFNGVALSAFCDTADFSVDVDTGDTTTFGSAWKSALAGIPGAKLELGGKYDGTAGTGPAAVIMAAIAAGVAIPIVHKPGGTASGQRTNSFSAIVTSYVEAAPVGGIVTFKCGLLSTGTVTTVTQ